MSEIPRWEIVNVAEIERTLKGPVLLHFTPEQWRYATRGAVEAELTEETATLQAMPLPGTPDTGVLVGVLQCRPSRIIWEFEPKGYPQPGTIVPRCPIDFPEPDPEPQRPPCETIVVMNEEGFPEFACSRWECNNCELQWTRTAGGGWFLDCVCLDRAVPPFPRR